MTVSVHLPGEDARQVEPGLTAGEVLKDKYGHQPLAAKVGEKLVDLNTPLSDLESDEIEISPILPGTDEGLDLLRHSTSHIMAEAVKSLFPEAKVAIGPSVADGFYYDFEVKRPFTPEDLPKIEAEMKKIIKAGGTFERSVWTTAEAKKKFAEMGEDYKVELIEDLEANDGETTVSVYAQGGFTDLCRGPHLPTTKRVPAFKLTSVAGAYWRGDENRRMLQRIYGTAFFDKKQLKAHLKNLEEAKKRDHRKLGKELDLFSFHDEIGPGMVVWHPKGAMLRTIIQETELRWHTQRGYEVVIGPQLLKRELWEKSGHFDNYRENMYFTEIDGQAYGVKPMNCLSHMLIFKSRKRSYRDLPHRYFELGVVHRHEKSGVLHGLPRVRQFTQDDAHILCTPEQVNAEIKGILDLEADMMEAFGFDYRLELSTRPEKSIGSDEDWELATNALRTALEDKGLDYTINEGDGAFYGPKIDLHLTDALNRSWQTGTIQCDFTLPERFDLTYTDSDDTPRRPIMLHRTILGSLERFVGILIEHHAGAFPVWLAPVQAKVLAVTDRVNDYCREVFDQLVKAGVRAELDIRNEKLGYKIREAQLQKIPYMLVVGDREAEAGTVAVRVRDGSDLGGISTAEFIDRVRAESTKNLKES